MTTYPTSPGYKGEAETGRRSAAAVTGKAAKMREAVVEAYSRSIAGLTHDECADRLRPDDMGDVEFETFKRSVRSRCSELKAQGKIVQTSERRENASHHMAVVWRAAYFNSRQTEFNL